jgi:uncharacterized protein
MYRILGKPGSLALGLKDEIATLENHVLNAAPPFPCPYGILAFQQNHIFFSVIERHQHPYEHFYQQVDEFLTITKDLPHRVGLITFICGAPESCSLADDEQFFWELLRFLYHQQNSTTKLDADDPSWRFPFANEELFFNGHSPHYTQRRSRFAPGSPFIVTQTIGNLAGLIPPAPGAEKISRRIHDMISAYDQLHPSPNLKSIAHEANSDWRQYWLPDTNDPDTRSNPFGNDY